MSRYTPGTKAKLFRPSDCMQSCRYFYLTLEFNVYSLHWFHINWPSDCMHSYRHFNLTILEFWAEIKPSYIEKTGYLILHKMHQFPSEKFYMYWAKMRETKCRVHWRIFENQCQSMSVTNPWKLCLHDPKERN